MEYKSERAKRRLAQKAEARRLRETKSGWTTCPCGERIPPPSLSLKKGVMVTSRHLALVHYPETRKSKSGREYTKYRPLGVKCNGFQTEPVNSVLGTNAELEASAQGEEK